MPTSADDIYSLIMKGDLKKASDSLSGLSTAALRDGNHLFYLSLVEPRADRAAQLMEAALRASVSAAYREEIVLRLAYYYFLRRDRQGLEKMVNEYRGYWETGQYRSKMLRFSILLHQMDQAHESAVNQADRYLLEYTDSDPAQWGLIDKARVLHEYHKDIGTTKLLKKLAREKTGPGIPQALYLLGMKAVKNQQADDAVFYYNILREGYPSAVGLDALMQKMATMSVADTDDSAEKRTGTFYSVQVGVFSKKDNAKKQAKMFSAYNQKIDIVTKKISGKEYRVVYVGHFPTYEAAYKFKETLEASHNEIFKVVAR